MLIACRNTEAHPFRRTSWGKLGIVSRGELDLRSSLQLMVLGIFGCFRIRSKYITRINTNMLRYWPTRHLNFLDSHYCTTRRIMTEWECWWLLVGDGKGSAGGSDRYMAVPSTLGWGQDKIRWRFMPCARWFIRVLEGGVSAVLCRNWSRTTAAKTSSPSLYTLHKDDYCISMTWRDSGMLIYLSTQYYLVGTEATWLGKLCVSSGVLITLLLSLVLHSSLMWKVEYHVLPGEKLLRWYYY
jgi:hypothetical protein